jgi:hypothetical protein
MRTELKYIELKSGFSDKGTAWIGRVTFSKSGKAIYFDGKGFKRLGGTGVEGGNYYEFETGNEYWIYGVKKDMSDRHKFGGGKIFVEKRILKEYLQTIGKTELPKAGYGFIEVDTKKPIERINSLENSQLEKSMVDETMYTKTPKELTNDELEYRINELIDDEKNAKYNKGRRTFKKKRIELETELGKRE